MKDEADELDAEISGAVTDDAPEEEEEDFGARSIDELDEEDLEGLVEDLDADVDSDVDIDPDLDPDLDTDLDEPDIDEEDDPVVKVLAEVPPRPRARAEDGDEEEEEEESDDVEADLDTILKDRLATHDEEEEEEEGEVPVIVTDEGELPQRKEFEFPCPSCFLLVNAKTVRRTGSCPQCGDPIEVPAGIG